MGRKSTYINQISEKDMDAFRFLWNCQHVPRELLKVTDNRIETYRKEKIIDVCKNSKNETVIRLTDKGIKYIRKLDDFRGRTPYRATTAAEHNCRMAQEYSKLSKEQQLNWRTEKELWKLARDRMEDLRQHDMNRYLAFQEAREHLENPQSWATDGGVVSDSGEVEMLVEVVTDNYGHGELEAHTLFCHVLEAEPTFIHT